jgi:hypothetical protein
MVELTPAQEEILLHALGLNQEDAGRDLLLNTLGLHQEGAVRPTRDYYLYPAGDPDVEALVAAGFFRDCGARAWLCGDTTYRCTDEGTAHGCALFAKREAAKPTLSRSQKRYRQFLSEDSSLRFGEWLKESKRGVRL